MESKLSKDNDLSKLSALRDVFSDDYLKTGPYPWVRLMLPLKVGEDVLGFWLFGRRDPDDFYSQEELPILKSLADQAAIALSNILQTERLMPLIRMAFNVLRLRASRFPLNYMMAS